MSFSHVCSSGGAAARAFSATILLAGLLLGPAAPATAQGLPTCAPGDLPKFTFGFGILKSQLGDWMGDPASCEFADPGGTGDVHQRTTTGLAFWRKSTNIPTFTNGSEHWALVDGDLVYWTGSSIDPSADAEPGGPNACVAAGTCKPVVAQAEPLVAASTPAPVPTATPGPIQPLALSEADITDRIRPSTVQVLVSIPGGTAAGSGVRVAQGILTNHHVVEGATKVEVIGSGGKRVPATVVRSDAKRDLALLDAPQLDIPNVDVAPAAQQRQGDQVLAFGYPRPDAIGSAGLSVTRGLVSAIRQNGDGVLVVQTDASVTHGNSGGPLVNMQGRLIGIIAYGVIDSSGLNFAISTEEVLGFLSGPATVVPSPTPEPASYHGDPQALAPVVGDLPDGWRQTDTQKDNGTYLVVFERTEPNGLQKAFAAYIEVENTIAAAQDAWRQQFGRQLDGFTPVPSVPKVGEESFAQTQSGSAILTFRVKNVNVALEYDWSDTTVPPFDDAVRIGQAIAGKVNAQAK